MHTILMRTQQANNNLNVYKGDLVMDYYIFINFEIMLNSS